MTSLIASLAFLKINYDANHNGYIDNFIPLLAECLRNSHEEIVSKDDLQRSLRECFGIKIPLHVITALLVRAKKFGYVTEQNHVYYRCPTKLNDLSFTDAQQRVQRMYSALVSHFINYVDKKYQIELSESSAEQLLLSFISYNQIAIIDSQEEMKVLPDYPKLSQSEKIIVAEYITTMMKTDPLISEYIETIVKGYMIANALYLPDLVNTNKRFQRTNIFFDTSFIIHALGYNGINLRTPCIELLELLYESGAQLCCFRHTFEEIKGIFWACSSKLGTIGDSPFGRTVEYFTKNGFSPSDVLLLISQLEEKIDVLRIKIIEKPDYKNHQYIIAEQELATQLKSKVKSYKDDALQRDVDSVSAIYRLRKGLAYYRIEDTRAIFVTPNSALYQVAASFYYKDHDPSSISPCITDFELTNIVWLKSPVKAPNLPMKRIIADCFAAIQPDEVLMGKWVAEIRKLYERGEVKEEDYFFMRYSEQVKTALVEFTLGDPSVISEGTIPEILERAQRKISEEADQRAIAAQKETAEEKSRRIDAENEVKLIRESGMKENISRQEKIKLKAHKISKAATRFLRVFTIVILAICVFLTLPDSAAYTQGLKSIIKNLNTLWIPGIFIILGVVDIVDMCLGMNVNSMLNKIELAIEKKVFAYLLSLTE